MNWSFTRRLWERRVGYFVCISLLLGLFAPPALARPPKATSGAPIEAQQVRTVWTSELGLSDPTGLAYLSDSRQLLVTGSGSEGNSILLGQDEDLQGRVQLDALTNPSTLSYDATADRITALDGQSQLEWSGSALDTGRANPRISSLVEDAKSAAYEKATGDLLLLSSSGREIIRVSGSQTSKIRLGGTSSANLIASNPSDSLIYVMNGNGTLDALDPTGSLVRSYDLTGAELVEPNAIVFAPTSDATDSSESMNLFVADSGGSQSPGGVVEISLTSAVATASVPVDNGSLVRSTATSAWNPGSPDPAGVTYLSDQQRLIVVDSEVDEVTGAGWHNVNMWRTYTNGTVQETGTFWGPNAPTFNGKVGFSKEPTGAGYAASTETLFVSDDSAKKVFVVKKGNDGKYGTSDDPVSAIDAAAHGSTDTEDPEFLGGVLYYLDGVGREIYRVDPVDAVFGNSNDVMTHFDISHLGPTDFEGLGSNPARGTLLVGARSAKRIFEITTSGSLLREISVSAISGLRYVSGLAFAPSSDNASLMSFYIVDRQVDNGSNANENDGVLWEVRAPDSLGGGGPQNQAPSVNAGADLAVTLPAGATLSGSVSDDGLPNGNLTSAWSVSSAPSGGVVTFGNPASPSTSATFNAAGTYVLRLTADDGQLSASDETTVQVSPAAGGGSAFTAVSQTSVYGTVSGGIEATYTAGDGATQDITEVLNGQGFRAKLEHIWTFNVSGTSRLTAVLNASRLGSENYKFAYSTNGGSTWKTMFTYAGVAEQQFLLPSGVTGTVLIRVRDVDRTQGDISKDTLRVDRLVLVPGA